MLTRRLDSLLQKVFLDCHVEELPIHKAISVDQALSCHEAIEKMNAEKIGCLLINSSSNPLIGVLTERDIVRKIWSERRSPRHVCVSEAMTEDPKILNYHASIAKALYLMNTETTRHVPVYLRDKSLAIFSATDIIRFLYKKMVQREISRAKLPDAHDQQSGLVDFFDGDLSLLPPSSTMSVESSATIGEIVESMIKSAVDSVVVANSIRKTVQGIFTERDILRKVILDRDKYASMPVEAVMSRNPITLQSTTSILYAFQTMVEGNFRHIPIVDFDEKLMGMLSIERFIGFVSCHILRELEST